MGHPWPGSISCHLGAVGCRPQVDSWQGPALGESPSCSQAPYSSSHTHTFQSPVCRSTTAAGSRSKRLPVMGRMDSRKLLLTPNCSVWWKVPDSCEKAWCSEEVRILDKRHPRQQMSCDVPHLSPTIYCCRSICAFLKLSQAANACKRAQHGENGNHSTQPPSPCITQ